MPKTNRSPERIARCSGAGNIDFVCIRSVDAVILFLFREVRRFIIENESARFQYTF
jgi:hypothetical protein